jgi:lysophospholipase
VQTAPMPQFAVTAMMRVFKLFGKGAFFLPGYGPYKQMPFEGNPWSISSRARYVILDGLNESRTEYQMGGLTACGGLELVKLSRAASAAAAKIEVPSLLVQAGLDEMVRNDAQDKAARAMGNCRVVAVKGAHHVIMHQVDGVRGQALSAIQAFLEEQTK